jgi:hypothetical protein
MPQPSAPTPTLASSLFAPKPLDAATDLPPGFVYRREAEEARVFFKSCADHLGLLTPVQERYKKSVRHFISSQKIESEFHPFTINLAWASEFHGTETPNLESILLVSLYFPKMYHYFDALVMRVMAEHIKIKEKDSSPKFSCADPEESTDFFVEAVSPSPSSELIISEQLLPDFVTTQIYLVCQMITFLLRHCTGKKLNQRINYLEIFLADMFGDSFGKKTPLTKTITLAEEHLFLSKLLRYGSEPAFHYIAILFLVLLMQKSNRLDQHLEILALFNQQYEENYVQETFGDVARLARLRVLAYHLRFFGQMSAEHLGKIQGSHTLFTREYKALFDKPKLTSFLSDVGVAQFHKEVFSDVSDREFAVAVQTINEFLP